MSGMIVPLLALVLSATQSTATPSPDIGSDLVKACKASVKVIDGSAATEDTISSEYCRGYIDAFTETFDQKAHGICPGDHARLGTVVRVYLAFMDKNPKLLDQPKWLGLGLSLADAYPCPKK
jgi:hypothetical protein